MSNIEMDERAMLTTKERAAKRWIELINRAAPITLTGSSPRHFPKLID
jgi:hypothetical protein